MKSFVSFIRKSIVSLLWIIVASGPMYGFDKTFTFDLADFELETKNGLVQIRPNNPSYSLEYNLPGFPNIPFYEYKFKTENACKLTTLRYEVIEKTLIASDIRVKLSSPCVPTGFETMPLKNVQEANYSVYPDSLIRLYNGPSKNNDRIVLSIAPFVYDKENRDLYFVHQVRVMYDEEPSVFFMQRNDTRNNARTASDIDYLIITQDSLVETFEKLRDWKTAKGIKTEIVSLDSIKRYCQSSSLKPTPLEIKTFLRDKYESRHFTMVLLGGSSRIVPVQRCRVQYYLDQDLAACDLFYSCFYDGNFAWNADNDSIIGEPGIDSPDLNPTISISRIPLETKQQFSAYIQKLLKYEKKPERDSYATRALIAGDCLYWHLTNNNLSDAHNNGIALDNVFQNSSYYPDGVNTGLFFDTGNNMGRVGIDSLVNATNISNIINTFRPHFLNMDTHGIETAWKYNGADSFFTTSHALSLCNDDAPMIIATSACHTGDIYGAHPCLGEAFLRHPTGGALAYWGSSKYGFTYGEEASSMGPSMAMCNEFWINLSTHYHFGEAVMETKRDFQNGANNVYNSNDWLLKSMNALGDCEVPIYTEEPKDISDVVVLIDHNTYDITSEEEYDMALVSKGDNGETTFFTDSSSIFYSGNHGQIASSICLTKHNYIPFYVETGYFVGSNGDYSLYLQNQEYNESWTRYEDDAFKYIYVGNNVYNDAENGDVIVESGATVELYATGKVIVDSGFRCNKGGKFGIK